MKKIRNSGCGDCLVLKQVQEYVLIASLDNNEFIVATYLTDEGNWSWGHYFKDLDMALEHFNERVGKQYGR